MSSVVLQLKEELKKDNFQDSDLMQLADLGKVLSAGKTAGLKDEHIQLLGKLLVLKDEHIQLLGKLLVLKKMPPLSLKNKKLPADYTHVPDIQTTEFFI